MLTIEPPKALPRLENGDCLSRVEFERRYEAMPNAKKAELIEGIVYMSLSVRAYEHGDPHVRLIGWADRYREVTEGCGLFDNATVRLDPRNEVQPDIVLRIEPSAGGRSSTSDDGYIEGSPELCVEIAASSVSYDLNQKKQAFQRSGVQEFLVWMVLEEKVRWWKLVDGAYVELPADPAGVIRSEVFPGLWLDAAALLSGEWSAFYATLRAGLESAAHQAFARELSKRLAG